MNSKIIVVLVFGAVLLSGCTNGYEPDPYEDPHDWNFSVFEPDYNVTPKGDRLVGLQVNEASDKDYGKAMAIAKEAGIQVVGLSIFWDEIEKTEGVYAPDFDSLGIANSYYPSAGISIFLSIAVLDTTAKRLPSYLTGKNLDDPKVIEDFKEFLDHVESKTTELNIVGISLGNEVDIYLSGHPEEWNNYKAFYETAKEYAEEKWPGKIGVKGTFYGLTEKAKEEMLSLNENSDMIFVTYYPLDNGFVVKDASVVGAEVDELMLIYHEKRIIFAELGYPSSSQNNSSQEKQMLFVKETFRFWDKYHDRIHLINFEWMHDKSRDEVNAFGNYYGSTDKKFLAYLGSLGLRTYDGKDKAGFLALKAEAIARGWITE